jgi:hypothetical protein
MAGVPFDVLENLATPGTTQAARELIARQAEFSRAKTEVEGLLASLKAGLSKEQFRLWRKAIRSGVLPATVDPPASVFIDRWPKGDRVALAESRLRDVMANEVKLARDALHRATRKFLTAYLVFAAPGVRERLIHQLASNTPATSPRNKQARADERHWLLYLQRLAAKNDSLSEFGPEGWGRCDGEVAKITFSPDPGIARRETFLERWAAHGVAAAINADPEVAPELAPRLHPNGRVEGDRFVFTETGTSMALDAETRALLARCDGKTPAHSLGTSSETLVRLAEQNLILWAMEVPALEPNVLPIFLADVSRWRDNATRERWQAELQSLADFPAKFARTTELQTRLALVNEATDRLEKLGAHKVGSRFLYSATNPIGEECFRECHFSIGQDLINEVATEAAPWIDLWRDNYAFVADRVAAGLRALFEQSPLQNGALPLPAFLRFCAQAQLPLTGPGMIVFAHNSFQEVKTAFSENFAGHADEREYRLSANDCHFVRREFEYEKFDEYTYPSADLQLGAESVDAVGRGDYQWVVAELHPPVALLHHGFFWCCPEPETLARALATTTCGKPNFHFGFFAADFTATTAVRLFDGLPECTFFVAAERANSHWRRIPPSELEVFCDQQTGDVRLRARATGEDVGSFARAWTIPLGFHPFTFSLGAHTPRLYCGKIVVQRESWTVALEELGAGDFTGISHDLVIAVERLRSARQLPRHVYIRPSEQALRRSGAEGRDKDTKPVYIDFESYLFLEIFHRWLTKAGELEITEMLPTPDQLLWREPDGRRTFELRTQIIPR